jgi:hypothetical protein
MTPLQINHLRIRLTKIFQKLMSNPRSRVSVAEGDPTIIPVGQAQAQIPQPGGRKIIAQRFNAGGRRKKGDKSRQGRKKTLYLT